MFYEYPFTVPKGTAEASPFRGTLKLSRGIIHQVEVRFEAGCQNEVSCVLRRRAHKLFPNSEALNFSSEEDVIKIREHYPLTSLPYELYFEGWSPDADYDHTLRVRIGILPEDILSPQIGVWALLSKFFKLIPGVK